MPRIEMVADDDATGPLAEIYEQFRANSRLQIVPEIMRTMSHRPDFMKAINAAAALHFRAGALSVAQHEMIASYVSALNRCRY